MRRRRRANDSRLWPPAAALTKASVSRSPRRASAPAAAAAAAAGRARAARVRPLCRQERELGWSPRQRALCLARRSARRGRAAAASRAPRSGAARPRREAHTPRVVADVAAQDALRALKGAHVQLLASVAPSEVARADLPRRAGASAGANAEREEAEGGEDVQAPSYRRRGWRRPARPRWPATAGGVCVRCVCVCVCSCRPCNCPESMRARRRARPPARAARPPRRAPRFRRGRRAHHSADAAASAAAQARLAPRARPWPLIGRRAARGG